MNERLLDAVLVAPFVLTEVGFAVAITLAPSVPNEIASATEHNHEEMDHSLVFLKTPAAILKYFPASFPPGNLQSSRKLCRYSGPSTDPCRKKQRSAQRSRDVPKCARFP